MINQSFDLPYFEIFEIKKEIQVQNTHLWFSVDTLSSYSHFPDSRKMYEGLAANIAEPNQDNLSLSV